MDLSRRNFIVGSAVAAAATLGDAAGGHAAPASVFVAQAGGAPAPRGFDPADPALKTSRRVIWSMRSTVAREALQATRALLPSE